LRRLAGCGIAFLPPRLYVSIALLKTDVTFNGPDEAFLNAFPALFLYLFDL